MRRSSLANPADILASRKRSITPAGMPAPERRSVSGPAQVNPAALPNRKAFVAEPEQMVERRDFEEPKVLPVNLPNRKAFIAPTVQDLEQRDVVPPKVLPVHLPNRKAFIAPETDDIQKRDSPAPKVLPSQLPNRKAYVAPDAEEPQIKVTMHDIPSFSTYTFPATPAAEKRDFNPFFVPNRKAFIHPDPAKIEEASAKISAKPYTFPPVPAPAPAAPEAVRRSFDPASLPNRKAFIHPDDLKINALSVSEDDQAPAPPSAAALRRSRRSLDPASLPNRKAFIAAPSVEVIADVEDAPSEKPEQSDEGSASQSVEDAGTAIPLFKRAGAPLKTDGTVDMDKAHVSCTRSRAKTPKADADS